MAAPEIFAVPPEEAIEHFRSKGFHVGFDWRDTAAAQHLRSFTVAKAMEVDLLEDIRGAVDRAIADGTTFEEFREELEPILRRRGWWGVRPMRDPLTGEIRDVQLGSPRRLRTIFDTNIRTAYARGRWKRIERTAEARPWLRYVSVLDARTRPDHRGWHGTVLRWDDPWWQTHYPPNGWNCRCIVQQLSDDDLERFGYEPTPSAPPGHGRLWTNSRTGETRTIPSGIDPGWDHNVGTADQVGDARRRLTEKAAAAPASVRAAIRHDLDSYVGAGRKIREELMREAGDLERASFVGNFRRALRRRLADERGAGSVTAEVAAGSSGGRTAGRVRTAAQELPASWVRAGNEIPLEGIRGSKSRGFYRYPSARWPAQISVSPDVGVPLHEYCHHLQRAMPELDAVFVQLHRRRTAGEPKVRVGGPKDTGRKDKYIRPYTGREYAPGDAPLEVFTMAVQMLFHPVLGREHLRQMVREDPELLDLVIGALFRYDP